MTKKWNYKDVWSDSAHGRNTVFAQNETALKSFQNEAIN